MNINKKKQEIFTEKKKLRSSIDKNEEINQLAPVVICLALQIQATKKFPTKDQVNVYSRDRWKKNICDRVGCAPQETKRLERVLANYSTIRQFLTMCQSADEKRKSRNEKLVRMLIFASHLLQRCSSLQALSQK
jgi:hypothetical protein